MTDQELLSTRQASDLLKSLKIDISAEKIANLARNNELKGAFKDNNGAWKIPRSALILFVHQKKVKNRRNLLSFSSIVALFLFVFAAISGIKDGFDLLKDTREQSNEEQLNVSQLEIVDVIAYDSVHRERQNAGSNDHHIQLDVKIRNTSDRVLFISKRVLFISKFDLVVLESWRLNSAFVQCEASGSVGYSDSYDIEILSYTPQTISNNISYQLIPIALEVSALSSC